MVDLSGVDTLVPCFPVRPNVRSGSAAVRTDGKIIYCYVDGGTGAVTPGQLRERSFATAYDMAGGVQANPMDVWRSGVPIEDSDMPIITGSIGAACSVWREGNELYLSVTYAGLDGDTLTRYSEVLVSGSGNGGDWTLAGTIQPPMPVVGYESELGNDAGTGMGYHGCLPMMRWSETGAGSALNWKTPTVYAGSGGSWTFDTEQGYGFGGAYGLHVSRRVVRHNGSLWWLSAGNIPSDGDKGAVGGPGGWTVFLDQPVRKSWFMPYLTSHGGHMLRMGQPTKGVLGMRIEACVDPQAGGWQAVTGTLHLGNITSGGLVGHGGTNSQFVWCDGIGAYGVLCNHDKAWLPMGGWLLGALGRS